MHARRSLLCMHLQIQLCRRFFLPPLGRLLPMGLLFVQHTQQDLSERDTRGHFLGLKLVPTSLVVSRLAESERDVAVFDHVLNLSSHYRIGASVQFSSSCTPLAIEWCHLLVKLKSIMKYTTNTGQNTGTLKIPNHVQTKAMAIALVLECQNLNSGNRLMKGRNSSSCFVGSVG